MRFKAMICSLLLAGTAFSSTNENIRFLENVREESKRYSKSELNRWNLGNGEAVVPESADINNLAHQRLLVAANPDRYEGYVTYGLHFFLQRDWEVAAAAYGRAADIVRRNKLTDAIEFGNYYVLSLIELYMQQRNGDKIKALRTFEKIIDYDFSCFDREPKFADCIFLAVSDYYSQGDRKAAMGLIQRAHVLKKLPIHVASRLAQMTEKIEKNVEPTNAPYSSPAPQVQKR
jgi:tetratricopeptide (TPR) repeat protein